MADSIPKSYYQCLAPEDDVPGGNEEEHQPQQPSATTVWVTSTVRQPAPTSPGAYQQCGGNGYNGKYLKAEI